MVVYTCTRNDRNLRSMVGGLLAVVTVELTLVAGAASVFLPGAWRLTAVLPLLVLGWAAWSLRRLLGAAHRLDQDVLKLDFGWNLRASIPVRQIIEVAEYQGPPPVRKAPKAVTTATLDDTLFAFTRPRELVQIHCDRVLVATSRGRRMAFSRIVVNTDEPRRLVEDLQRVLGREDRPAPSAEATAPVPGRPWPVSDPSGDCRLTLSGVVKRFGDVMAVSQVDLGVAGGEIHGLLGRNGAGKTTLLKMVVGLLVPDRGTITVCGYDLWSQPEQAKRHLGYVPDAPVLYERLSGYEFLQFIGGLYRMSPESVKQAADPLLELLDLARWIDRPIHTYSSGTKRKLSLIAALLHHPRVLVLDEVTNALDAVAIAEVKHLLTLLKEEGVATLVTTHLLGIASDLCDTITIIHEGRVLSRQRRADWTNNAESLEAQFLRLTVQDKRVGSAV